MKFVLILMIKNEERILKRCLEALTNIVDCFCICDTGSTDTTKEIALDFLKDHSGCLTEEPFRDFGYNRTVSFNNAQAYLKDNNWDLFNTYGLLLDADMMFISGTLKQQTLTEQGYRIIQKNGNLEYYNARIIRMDYTWRCVGVTHEYWSGPQTGSLSKDICFIDDRNDGGCKHDKFERDARLLEQGIVDEPTNERYMFYLAQTYKCLAQWDKAIKMYTKRIEAGGWAEEIWYSYYMIGECYKATSNYPDFEKYMQLAYFYRQTRSESLYKLAEFFRINGDQYKAYHYIQLGKKVPFPKDDVLFIESNVYNGLFEYEASIVEYYIHLDRGLKSSMSAMLKTHEHQHNIISNLKFYVKPLKATIERLSLPRPFGDVFTPSAISVCDYPMANVRYVNYTIQPNGSYVMPNNIVETRNAYVNLDTLEYIAFEEPAYKFDMHIKGLEDLRLYKEDTKLKFTATSFKQFIADKISIVSGEYDIESKTYTNCVGIESPTNSECEKNWVHIPGTNEFIYSWSPLRIGRIENNTFSFTKEVSTLPFFSLLRGSASPIEVNGKWLVLTHFVEYCQPRKYYHCFVELEKQTYKVLKVSTPFVFEKIGIEYCISGELIEDSLELYFSSWDKDPARITCKLIDIQWIVIGEETKEKNSIIRVPSNLRVYWDGPYSRCHAHKDIEGYINSSINKQKLPISAIFSMSDGIVDKTEFNTLQKNLGYELVANTCETDYLELMKSVVPDTIPLICMLCSRNFTRPNLMLLPLDDDTFKVGLEQVLAGIKRPSWEERKPIAFWRGGSSGFDRPKTIRMKVTEKLFGNPLTDVRITKWGTLENEKDIPEEHFGNRCSLEKHFEYKYIFIIDGNLIASNHQWVFGSGSVPIMVTHPGNNYWFKNYLIPMKHYVPISYDLSDLEEKIEWLVNNDDKAKEIATNALEFSREVFNPSFQRKYIDEQLTDLYNKNLNKEMLEHKYVEKCNTRSDINEHLPTLREYASKCSSVVECGVRTIVSSYAFATGLKNNPNNMFTLIDPYKSDQIGTFLNMCKAEGVNATFLEESDLKCSLVETDLLFIDTWHIYGQLKRELAYWNSSVKKYIIMHDTTVDEWQGETIRCGSNGIKEAAESGFPRSEIMRGLWPAVEEFLVEHPEWKIEKRYTNNNGLTILCRI